MERKITYQNDVIVVGELCKPPRRHIVNNQKALGITLKVPINNDTYNLVYANLLNDNFKFFKNKLGKVIALNGHIECKRGLRIIIDNLAILEEN